MPVQEDKQRYFEFPETSQEADVQSLFIGGGISNCPDWQKPIVTRLGDSCAKLIFFNPRRAVFDITEAKDSIPQIQWEHQNLKKSSAILFWFPKETLCPITLYELGAWSMTQKKLFVGVHPDYARKVDVYEQTRLARPDITVVDDLDKLAQQVEEWYTSTSK